MLLLDGFDETSDRFSSTSLSEALRQLSPLYSTRSPTIISSRPTYLAEGFGFEGTIAQLRNETVESSGAESSDSSVTQLLDRLPSRLGGRGADEWVRDKLPNFRVARIDPLSQEAINSYLRHRNNDFRRTIGIDSDAVLDFVQRTYDLSDLTSRPLLLDMIAETLQSFPVEMLSKRMGLFDIYEAY